VIDDIVQEAAARLSPQTSLGEAVAIVDGLVREEADRLGRRCVAVLSPGGGVPALLPAFLGLVNLHPRPAHFRRALGAAALDVAKMSLGPERFFLFFLAWLECDGIDGIILVLGGDPDDARTLRRRLRRVAATVEQLILRRLDPVLPYRERTWLRAAVSLGGAARKRAADILPPPEPNSWAVLTAALGKIIHGVAEPRTTDSQSDSAATSTL
jgi:hypothetical protein